MNKQPAHPLVHAAVSAVHSGKHTPNHVATLRKAKAFLTDNKSHEWGKSKALVSAFKKVHLGEGVITRDNLIAAIIEAIDPKQLKMGIEVEKEHGDRDKSTDVVPGPDAKGKKTFAKIAKAHLKEIPDYYTRLAKMEKEGKKAKVSEAVGERTISPYAMRLTRNDPTSKSIFRHVSKHPHEYRSKMLGKIATLSDRKGKMVSFRHEEAREALIRAIVEEVSRRSRNDINIQHTLTPLFNKKTLSTPAGKNVLRSMGRRWGAAKARKGGRDFAPVLRPNRHQLKRILKKVK